jgi:hypothetical protein
MRRGFYGADFYFPYPMRDENAPPIPAQIKVNIAYDNERDIAYTREVDTQIADNSISFVVAADGRLETLSVNGRDLRHLFAEQVYHSFSTLSPIVRHSEIEKSESLPGLQRQRGLPLALVSLAQFVQRRMHGNTSLSTAIGLVRRIPLGNSQHTLEQVKRVFGAGTRGRVAGAASWTQSSTEFSELRDLCMALFLPQALDALNERIASLCRSIRYIEPLRATADRFYRFQDLAVDEIDPQGRNLPMFIHALSQGQLEEFQKWTTNHFGFDIKPDRHAGHLSLLVNECGRGVHNLADSGFGYSQVLPIATQLWWQSTDRPTRYSRTGKPMREGGMLAMEQPELHLHPRLQAQIADTFAAAVKHASEQNSPFRIVAETHSEPIVNRLGELIASKSLRADQVNVVLFEREAVGTPAIVRCVEYDDKGYLKDWPYGFFNADTK